MVLVVKNTLQRPSGRWFYRRYWPLDLRHLFPTTRFLVSIGHKETPGFLSRYEKAADLYAQQVAQVSAKLYGHERCSMA